LSIFTYHRSKITSSQHLNHEPNSAVAIHPGVASTEKFAAMPRQQRKLLSLLPTSWRPTMQNVEDVADRVIKEAVRSNEDFGDHSICDGLKPIPTNADTTQKDEFMLFIEQLTNGFL
ncbi:hypothetical protein PENTCL1PPCAC_27989, partial [Pristionchus entomophagus]